MFTQETNLKTDNQSNDWYSQLTDKQKVFLETFRTPLFYPENNPEESHELLNGFEEIEMPQASEASELREEFREYTTTADILVRNALNVIPHLWYPYFPSTALVGISGASEAGKSTFARQLALAICNGDSDFLTKPLNLKHKSIIYISTEDEEVSMGVLIKKQTASTYKDGLPRFRAGMNVVNAVDYLEKELKKQKADLVVIDVWSDLYGESPNDFSKVRRDLNKYAKLSRKFKTCICIIHHNTKHSRDNEPSKTNLNGSQAIEAKLRTLLELRVNPDNVRQLSVIKGNYIPFFLKKRRLMLKQNEDMNLEFYSEEEAANEQTIANPKSEDEEVKERAIHLYTIEGYAQTKVREILLKEFGERAPSHGTLSSKMLKGHKRNQSKKS